MVRSSGSLWSAGSILWTNSIISRTAASYSTCCVNWPGDRLLVKSKQRWAAHCAVSGEGTEERLIPRGGGRGLRGRYDLPPAHLRNHVHLRGGRATLDPVSSLA